MIYLALLALAVACAAISIHLAFVRYLTSIAYHNDTAIPQTRFNGWRAKLPLIGALNAQAEKAILQLRHAEIENRLRYKILTDNVAAAVILHGSTGEILWCSPFTEVLTGFPLSEIYRNRSGFILSNVNEEDREIVARSSQIVATGEPFQCRYRFYHKSGIALWLETRTVPIFDPAAQEYLALSITLDVTAHVISQVQAEERNQDLREFTYMISHDLKTPILTIAGMLKLLEEDQSIAEKHDLSEPLSYIRKATNRLNELVGGVLELARISAADRSTDPVDLNDILREVVDEHRFAIEEAQAQINSADRLPVVLGNQTHLYQIISNLISNAIKYRDRGRQLVVGIEIEPAASRRKIVVVVRDNGRGIAADKLEQIFQPFNRAGEQEIAGTGIGLASVKKLVEKLGGAISVKSEVGSGTTFRIELRRAADAGPVEDRAETDRKIEQPW